MRFSRINRRAHEWLICRLAATFGPVTWLGQFRSSSATCSWSGTSGRGSAPVAVGSGEPKRARSPERHTDPDRSADADQDRNHPILSPTPPRLRIVIGAAAARTCLLYTSDAADDLLCVDLGGRRII